MGKTGKASIIFDKDIYIVEKASVVGQKEGEGPLGKYFDNIVNDPFVGKNTWEEAESELQKLVVKTLLKKSGLTTKDIRYIFAGDLLGQLIASSFGLMDFEIPFFGLYGACSTMGESMSLAAMNVAAGYADNVIALTSSHFASAEKQFRYPLEYGSQRPLCATWTVTGSGGVIISSCIKSGIRIAGITTGKIVDYGITDSMNMGAAMAPAASRTISTFLKDTKTSPSDYDLILTGDLGYTGTQLLYELLEKDHNIKLKGFHKDCGMLIYDLKKQDVNSGGSGCGCSASVLCSHIMKQIDKGILKKVLFVATGALMSPTSSKQGNPIPGIAHAVLLEG